MFICAICGQMPWRLSPLRRNIQSLRCKRRSDLRAPIGATPTHSRLTNSCAFLRQKGLSGLYKAHPSRGQKDGSRKIPGPGSRNISAPIFLPKGLRVEPKPSNQGDLAAKERKGRKEPIQRAFSPQRRIRLGKSRLVVALVGKFSYPAIFLPQKLPGSTKRWRQKNLGRRKLKCFRPIFLSAD